MRISRFQLKLTLIFLIVLLIPAIIAAIFTRYVLTEGTTGMDVDKKVEEVLEAAREIAYDIIEEAELECQSTAEEIADDEGFMGAFDSTDKLECLISGIAPVGGHLSVDVFDFRTDLAKGEVRFSTGMPFFIIRSMAKPLFL